MHDAGDIRNRIAKLRSDIQDMRERREPSQEEWGRAIENQRLQRPDMLVCRKTVTVRDAGAVQHVGFGPDSIFFGLSCGAQSDGNAMFWDIHKESKQGLIMLESTWVLSALYEKTQGELFCCGMLDGNIILYRPNFDPANCVVAGEPHYSTNVPGHEAAVSDIAFSDATTIVSAGADKIVKIWSLEPGNTHLRSHTKCVGHTMDCFCCDAKNDLILTGAGDYSARQWDPRTQANNVASFDTGSRDVNDITIFPDGYCFGVGLSNTEAQIYDTRASCKLATYCSGDVRNLTAAEKVTFSPSGRLMFVMYENGSISVYDVAAVNGCGEDGKPLNNRALTSFGGHAKSMAVHQRGTVFIVSDVSQPRNTNIKLYWPRAR